LNPGVSNITFLIISHDFSPCAMTSKILAVSYFNAIASIFDFLLSFESSGLSDRYDY
jgi:hypothetical protein